LRVSDSAFSLDHPAPTYPSTLSLHDALPIWRERPRRRGRPRSLHGGPAVERGHPATDPRSEQSTGAVAGRGRARGGERGGEPVRSEEHTSELQSLRHLVCRLLLEKKKNTTTI